jgi:glycosyltransferase involved in cell wall biosynthesis
VTPEVSVVLPTFDRPALVREAVQCVFAQTHGDWELVIADDGSGEETRRLLLGLDDPRVTVLWLPHCGNPAAVRNRAIRTAHGRYIAFLDSDDLWSPHKLDAQLRAMRLWPNRRWSYTKIEVTDRSGRPLANKELRRWRSHEGEILEALIRSEALVAMPTVLAERTLLLEAGGFDENLRYGEDYDLWFRLAASSEVTLVPEPLAIVRKHEENFSRDHAGLYAGLICAYEKASHFVADERLQSLCRRRRADIAILLARLHGDRGDTMAFAKVLSNAARDARPSPMWWTKAFIACVRHGLRSVPGLRRSATKSAR